MSIDTDKIREQLGLEGLSRQMVGALLDEIDRLRTDYERGRAVGVDIGARTAESVGITRFAEVAAEKNDWRAEALQLREQVDHLRMIYDASLELRRIESTDVPGESIGELEANASAAHRRTMAALTKWRTIMDAELRDDFDAKNPPRKV